MVSTFHTTPSEKFASDALDRANCGEYIIIPNFLHYIVGTIPLYLPSFVFKSLIKSIYAQRIELN